MCTDNKVSHLVNLRHRCLMLECQGGTNRSGSVCPNGERSRLTFNGISLGDRLPDQQRNSGRGSHEASLNQFVNPVGHPTLETGEANLQCRGGALASLANKKADCAQRRDPTCTAAPSKRRQNKFVKIGGVRKNLTRMCQLASTKGVCHLHGCPRRMLNF